MNAAALQNLLSASVGGRAAAASDNSLVSFRAGHMKLEGTSVRADARKGRVLLLLQNDGLMHLQWRLRPADTTQIDLICMPGECRFEKVPECSDGRVYMLEFTTDKSRRQFFWMQDLSDADDEESIKKMNDYLSGRTSPPGLGGGGGSTGSSGGLGAQGDMLLSMINGYQQQRQQQQQQQQQQPARVTQQSRGGAPAALSSSDVPSSLNGVLDPDLVLPLLEDDETLEALLPHLPAEQRTREALRDQLRSPQLRQTLTRLTAALNNGQAAPLIAQLGLPSTNDIGVDALLRALQERADAEAQRKNQSNGSDS